MSFKRATRREFLQIAAGGATGLGLTSVIWELAGAETAVGDPPSPESSQRIGPTLIPFYTGNLSVDIFMYYWGTAKGSGTGISDVTPDLIETLHQISVFADTDYLAWCISEKEKGVWDFAYYQENARRLHQSGLQYDVFCWVHFPPKWAVEGVDFTPYVDLESGQPTRQVSAWDPNLPHIYGRYYAELKEHLGDQIDFLRVAYPSEYGEIGYPNGMTNWLVPQVYPHPGYWCADRYAKADYQKVFLARYGSLDALNRAWGTGFATAEEITFPAVKGNLTAKKARVPANIQARRYWLDFVNWFQDHVNRCFREISRVVRRNFPDKKQIGSLGYGSEKVCYGNDTSRHVKMLHTERVSAQTPGAIGYFATRRVSSACHFYHTGYYTEPPGDVDPMDEVKRIWMDASNGAQVYFDYPQNLKRAIPEFIKYKIHLNGRRSLTDVAYFFPSSSFWLEPDMDWPTHTYAVAEALRNQLDFEIIDELMIQDGALDAMGIHTLVWVEGNLVADKTLSAVHHWIERGGSLIRRGTGLVYDLDGQEAHWINRLPAGQFSDNLRSVWGSSHHPLGAGTVIVIDVPDTELAHFIDCVPEFSVNRTAYDARSFVNAVMLNHSKAPTVFPSLFSDRILYLNDSRTDRVEFSVQLRQADFQKRGLPVPEPLSTTMKLPPRSIGVIWLKSKQNRTA